MLKKIGLAFLSLAVTLPAMANVVIYGTRQIYSAGQKSLNIQLENVGSRPALVQSWLDRGDEHSTPDSVSSKVPFIITPPVTRINAKQGQTLRVVYTGEALPNDRESVFYLNVLDIPPKPTGKVAEGNYLQFSIRSRIKFFFRPPLAMQPHEAYDKVQWSYQGNQLTAYNPTPYHISFISVILGSGKGGVKAPQPQMVAPFSRVQFLMGKGVKADLVRWKVINDYGGETEGSSKVQ